MNKFSKDIRTTCVRKNIGDEQFFTTGFRNIFRATLRPFYVRFIGHGFSAKYCTRVKNCMQGHIYLPLKIQIQRTETLKSCFVNTVEDNLSRNIA